jgi:hypothetical protein
MTLDGTPVQTTDLGLGETAPLDIDVTGALRLKLTATVLSDPDEGSCSSGDAVWADAKLLGVPSEVPKDTSSG